MFIEAAVPELPDITVYVEALERFVLGHSIEKIHVRSPFVVRTFDPEIAACEGRVVTAVSRLGKRVVFELEDSLFVVVHLMIAGRFHWRKPDTRPTRKVDLAVFGFEHGSLLLTEPSQKKRASIHVVSGANGLDEHRRQGLDVLECSLADFHSRLQSENRTLKRALTDPHIFDGIGNAYSDEILHAARLSPAQLTSRLTEENIKALYDAIRTTLTDWIVRLRKQTGDKFPAKVTAFHPEMAVHGRFGEACPDCGCKVQRIVYATRELNYCPGCQTGGKVLRDRSLSRLLKDDWPATAET